MLNTPNLITNDGVAQRNSIFFDPKRIHVNHVNLIGEVSGLPRFYELPTGRKVVQFSLATRESYLDEEGVTRKKSHRHRIVAWGRWVQVVKELIEPGMELAIEGKLTSRFFIRGGEKQFISEVEVNDLIII